MCSCIIPDCLKYVTVTVHTFISVVLCHAKTVIPLIKKVIYFSDRTAYQYINLKNYTNLCYHK